MILIWRGRGLLAMIGPFALLAPISFVSNDPFWLQPFAVSAGLTTAGLICIYCGIRWNRPRTYHSLYGIPLETCGWIDLLLAGVWLALVLTRVIREDLYRPGGMVQAGLMSLGLGVLLALMVATARYIRRAWAQVSQ